MAAFNEFCAELSHISSYYIYTLYIFYIIYIIYVYDIYLSKQPLRLHQTNRHKDNSLINHFLLRLLYASYNAKWKRFHVSSLIPEQVSINQRHEQLFLLLLSSILIIVSQEVETHSARLWSFIVISRAPLISFLEEKHYIKSNMQFQMIKYDDSGGPSI